MLELFKMMNSDTIIIKANGTEATLAKVGAMIILTIASDRRITDEEMREAFGIPDGTPPATFLDSGPIKRSRASWVVGM